MHTDASLSLNLLTERLAVILGGLFEMVAVGAERDRTVIPLLVRVWSRLNRTLRRFERLVARVLAGGPAAVRRAGPARDGVVAVPDARPGSRLPQGFGWLLLCVREVAFQRLQVAALLQDPDMLALLAAEPGAGRILRPLCRMLGVDPGPAAAPPGATASRHRGRRPVVAEAGTGAKGLDRRELPIKAPSLGPDIWACYGGLRTRRSAAMAPKSAGRPWRRSD